MRFFKYHGLGNDFVIIEDFAAGLLDIASQLAPRFCDRHFGIGADGLVLITKPGANYTMRIFNVDGTEAEMCGNAIRCVAKHLLDCGFVQENPVIVGSLSAPKVVTRVKDLYQVDMGEPIFEPARIPMIASNLSQAGGAIVTAAGQQFMIYGVSMGNPHGIVFVDEVGQIPLALWGPALETLPLWPTKANISFVKVLSRYHLHVRVWERGVGPTLACGTGACASAVISARLGYSDRQVTVSLPGGDLHVEWRTDNHVWMSGPATQVFSGYFKS